MRLGHAQFGSQPGSPGAREHRWPFGLSPAFVIALRYLIVVLVSAQLVLQLWRSGEAERRLDSPPGPRSEEATCEAWRGLASQIESGAVRLSPQEQAAKLRQAAAIVSSDAEVRRARAASALARHKTNLDLAFGALAVQVLLAVAFTVSEIKQARKRAPDIGVAQDAREPPASGADG